MNEILRSTQPGIKMGLYNKSRIYLHYHQGSICLVLNMLTLVTVSTPAFQMSKLKLRGMKKLTRVR